jgi:hypothetical protein
LDTQLLKHFTVKQGSKEEEGDNEPCVCHALLYITWGIAPWLSRRTKRGADSTLPFFPFSTVFRATAGFLSQTWLVFQEEVQKSS